MSGGRNERIPAPAITVLPKTDGGRDAPVTAIDKFANKLFVGDCVEVMRSFPDDSIDCIVTDPPYGIGFMGKKWDKALPPKEAFRQMHRVLKPGALAFVMSSPRQDVLWRMMQMLEECGFQLRQSFISWIYKTGFPKAYDVSLGIDKKFIRVEFIAEHGRKPTRDEMKALLKAKRKVLGVRSYPRQGTTPVTRKATSIMGGNRDKTVGQETNIVTEPYHPSAKTWNGWKSITGLKPALECVLMVNKPLSEKTIVDNVLKHGVGGINVDACRIPFQNENPTKTHGKRNGTGTSLEWSKYKSPDDFKGEIHQKGRFPANLLVSDGALDTGKITKGNRIEKPSMCDEEANTWGGTFQRNRGARGYSDVGDQSRYFDLDAWARHHGFLDVPKASKKERDKGCENLPTIVKPALEGDTRPCHYNDTKRSLDGKERARLKNFHPTVKPVKLMAYLIELGCPPDGIVLDPFVGSGTTCIAASKLGRQWIGIEINPEYAEIACARITAEYGDVETETVKQKVIRKKKVIVIGNCSYEGECTYRVDGDCTYGKYCSSKVK